MQCALYFASSCHLSAVTASVEVLPVFQQMKRDDGKFTHYGYDDHFWRLALGFKPCGKAGKCAHAVG